MSTTDDVKTAPAAEREMLRGSGPDLGPYARRFDLPERTLLHVLRHQAEARPDHPWLVFDGSDTLTFGAAQAQVHQAGHALRAALPADGGQVALFLRNQIEFFPAFLGAQSARGVAVPLNADSRGPLLQFVIEKCEAEILVARADLLDRLEALEGLGAVRLIVVCGQGEGDGVIPSAIHGAATIRWSDFLSGQPTTPVGELPTGMDVGLIQFTSGTTGNSKGVVYPHQFLYLYSAMVSDTQERTCEDVLSTPLPLFHVAALHIVAGSALHAGCTAHLKSRFSAGAYWQEVADDGATFGILLGPMTEIILKSDPLVPAHRMQQIFCVPFPPNGEEFERRYGVELLWQGYGMTEIYPLPMPRRMEAGVPRDTIGRPVSWIEFAVVDTEDRVLPAQEVGELVFRPRMPHAMAREYFKAPEATNAAFRSFMFHTGDLACYDAEGRIHYRGRQQDRIRRRGENISAAELEFVAMSHPLVIEAAAYGVPGEFGDHDVKLDLVPQPGLVCAELHAWLIEQLPRYMVPRYIEFKAELPKTPSQKIQKYQLAQASLDREAVFVFEMTARS
jgi:crotonobetaine/carnitine-CoA ligase